MDRLDVTVIAGLTALVTVMVWAAVADQRSWQKFASEHDCQIVAKREGGTSTGFVTGVNGKSGVVTVFDSGDITYLCNDGVEYTR